MVVPVANADKSKANLVQKLSTLDSFHPELSNDSYKEWHYFNIIDEANDLKFFVSFNVGGNQTEPTGYGIVLMAYMVGDDPGQMGGAQEYYPIQDVDVSDESPDLTFDESNYVRLMPNGYRVNAEIDGTDVFGNPIQIIYDATYIPKADPTLIFNGLIGDTPGDMNWVSAAPACRVEGSLTINGIEYNLDGVRGYHDHNFGNWDWGDNIGWDWGQAIEMNDDDPDTDVGRYTIVLGRLTDGSHTSDTGNRLLLWKNKAQIGIFQNVEFEYAMMEPFFAYPEYINATAQSGDDSVTSVFHSSSAMPIIIDPNLPFTIWELTGIYTVTGTIDGKSINFSTEGFAEYAY
ncbi:MAG: hypothetical protein KJ729_06925 [Euryarchaeota archaeon]|nr:hypothetical protein [Euryarchaeota archaeon]